jgi:hypothetical protein
MAGEITPFSLERALESDIKKLEAEVRAVKNSAEHKEMRPREAAKESLRAFIPQSVPQQANTSKASDAGGFLPVYMQDEPAGRRLEVERLIEVSLRDGFAKAFAEAAKSGAFMVDALHDALATKIYPELQKRGLL